MEIVNEYPPNIKQIEQKVTPTQNTVFTYGDKLYNPGGHIIPPHLLRHEEVHSVRQGQNPSEWWERYLSDPQFRIEEEVAAYQVQYSFVKAGTDSRSVKRTFLQKLARDLSSPMYGKVITFEEAKRRIKGEN